MNGFEYCKLGGKCQIALYLNIYIYFFFFLLGWDEGIDRMGQNGGKNYVFI